MQPCKFKKFMQLQGLKGRKVGKIKRVHFLANSKHNKLGSPLAEGKSLVLYILEGPV